MTGDRGGPVQTALIGVGMMGSVHARILAASPAAELVVACDPDAAAASRLPHGVELVSTLEQALDRPGLEAVVIASPQQHHRIGVEAALQRGLAVFCEKPLAADLVDADALVAAGSRPGAKLVVGHTFRFDPRYQAIAAAVSRGELGRPIQLTHRGNVPDFEGAALAARTSLAVENLVHSIDLMQWLAGPVRRVYGEASATDVFGPGVVDAIAVTARFHGGAVATLTSAWNMPSERGYGSEHFFSLLGSEGLAWIDGRDSGTGIVGRSGTSFPTLLGFDDATGAPQGIYRREIEAFLGGVRAEHPWPVSLAEARSALAVAVAIDASIDAGRPMDVDTSPAA